jgi:hypothetical protein
MTNKQIEKYIENKLENICIELQKMGASIDWFELIAHTEDKGVSIDWIASHIE